MANDKMLAQVSKKPGFFAALDQSGGSTPGALKLYGIPESAYNGDAEMFKLIHEMRVRIITAPAFTGDKVIGAILFEATMDGQAEGKPVPSFLWEDRGVVPFLKVDKGLETEADGVQLMKPIPGLDGLLERAAKLGIFGTKMRSVIKLNSQAGIAAIAKQQFELGADRGAWSRANPGTRGVDQESGQGRRRGHAARGAAQRSRRAAGEQPRHA
jgi:fructose-bisphosphate aldolase class I